MGRRRKHARRQLRAPGAIAAPPEAPQVPFNSDVVRAAVEKLRSDHYDPEIRAARWEAWQKEEDDLQREWDEWGRDAWIARYGQGEQQ